MFYNSSSIFGFDYGIQGKTNRSISFEMKTNDGRKTFVEKMLLPDDWHSKSKRAGGTFDLCWSGGYPEIFSIEYQS